MNDLEREQREMRERMNQQTTSKKSKTRRRSVVSDTPLPRNNENAATDNIDRLRKRIVALEAENRELKTEIDRLRRQKTVYVEREKSGEDLRRENAHNYFKYGGGRRW